MHKLGVVNDEASEAWHRLPRKTVKYLLCEYDALVHMRPSVLWITIPEVSERSRRYLDNWQGTMNLSGMNCCDYDQIFKIIDTYLIFTNLTERPYIYYGVRTFLYR